MVSVDELQKAVADSIRDKMNPQEPPSVISTATSAQLLMLPSPFPIVDTSGIGDTMQQKPSAKVGKEITIGKSRQIATSDPIVQTIGTPQIVVIDSGTIDEDKEISKEEE